MERHGAIADQLLPLPEWRWAVRAPIGAAGVAASAALIMVLAHIAYAFAMGHALYNSDDAALVPVETSAWAALISSVLTATGFYMQMTSPRRMYGALSRLPFKNGIDPREALLKVAHKTYSGRTSLAVKAGVGGYVTGILFCIFGIANTIPDEVIDQRWAYTGWFLIFVPIQFAVIGRATSFMHIGNKAMRQWAEANMLVDPLAPDALQPLARIALRGAGEWFIILTVGMLILLGQTLEPLLMGPLYIAGFALGVAAFVSPMRQAHSLLAASKEAALQGLIADINAERAALAHGGADGAAAGQRLSGLLAYRAALLEAREWPVDIGILARLVVYMAFPVLGWVGSALVQNAMENTLF